MPWTHLTAYTDGCCGLCCLATTPKLDDASINRNSFGDIFNQQHWCDTRLKMLAGVAPADCWRCFKEEQSGYKSHRIVENNIWEKRLGRDELQRLVNSTTAAGKVEESFQSLDLRVGNTCNLQCVMCGPSDSGRWAKHALDLSNVVTDRELQAEMDFRAKCDPKNYSWHQQGRVWEEVYEALPRIKELVLAGGEPFLIEGHLDILKKIANSGFAKNIILRYHTNCTVFSSEIVEELVKFKKVELCLSIDSYGEKNDWIRYPSKWDDIVKNMHLMDQTPENVDVWINFSLMAMNILYVPEWITFFDSQNFKKISKDRKSRFNPSIVHNPDYLSILVLPAKLKQAITKKIQSFEEELEWKTDKLLGVVQVMNSEDKTHLLPKTRQYIEALDRVRGTDFRSAFPEVARYLYG